ncbi:tetratricopeptide repeat protein [Taylorella equigenitalis]|nr:hypothetical protein [Taylorella equigenitalis]WEE01003.1 hypothetical protein PZB79_03055 [Taylorella equigenitalis]WEE02481.1 hypothetical protein PZB80_03060 [Taylorella equigenitalis]WFD79020.1 hypothetical protein P7C95_03065 [Taylorella equigenitalis]WFD80494.1 hypothetical protein P7C94_03065 [Taylorella equigenitalis]WFD81973.1 hypothetical protein P7C86_03065 [Taylorella equigenitalis]
MKFIYKCIATLIASIAIFGSVSLAHDPSPDELSQKGTELYKQQKYEEAFEYLKPAADQGQVQAQVAVGVMYLKGLGVPKNYDEATKYFEKSAKA